MKESIGLAYNHYFRSKEHAGNMTDYRWKQCLYRRYRMFHADVECNGPKSMLRNFDVKEGFSKRLVDFLKLDVKVGTPFPHCNKAGERPKRNRTGMRTGTEYEKLVQEELNLYMAKHDLQ